MTYEIDPQVHRLIPFSGEGALARVDLTFGPIIVTAKLHKNSSGYFLSYPGKHSESREKWYEHVIISDVKLKAKAQTTAVSEYERMQREDCVAV